MSATPEHMNARMKLTEDCKLTPKQAIVFVKVNGIVLESGRGPVPNLAEAVAGECIQGSWWGHPKANDIFLCTRAVRKSPDVLVCRLVGGKVSYIHRRLWSALLRLARRFDTDSLAAIQEVHTPSGKHEVHSTALRDWVPQEVKRQAAELTEEKAVSLLSTVPLFSLSKRIQVRRRTSRRS